MKQRNRLSNPRTQRRLSIGVIALGGALAGLGAFLRADGSANSTYYLDVAGWLTIMAGAVLEAKTAQLFLGATPRSARRRALAFAVAGLVVGLAGCVAASSIAGSDPPALFAAIAMFSLVGGIGLGLAGFFSLAWFYGGEYAAGRIERLSDEEW